MDACNNLGEMWTKSGTSARLASALASTGTAPCICALLAGWRDAGAMQALRTRCPARLIYCNQADRAGPTGPTDLTNGADRPQIELMAPRRGPAWALPGPGDRTLAPCWPRLSVGRRPATRPPGHPESVP